MVLNVGIIGCGSAAKVHLQHLKQHPSVKLVALCDPSPVLPAEFQGLGITKYDDYKKMLEQEKIDAVSIASPHSFHYEQILACAKRGIHVLCEKPLAITFPEAVSTVVECKKNKVKLAVMLQRRLFNNTTEIKKVIENGALGKITKLQYNLQVNKTKEYYQGWRGKKKVVGGGVLLCQGLHDLDRIITCLGKPTIVSSIMRTTRNYIDVEDEAEIHLQFPKEIKGHITATTNSSVLWSGKISIIGSKGSIVIDSEKIEEWNVPGVPEPSPNIKKDRGFVPAYYDPCHEEIIENFLDSILQNKEPVISGESTLPALELLFEIYEKGNNTK
ncbi:MAG: Gfo/Idh/MocA family oxidoreductase [Nanoarchaeota archaeon]|nr:Gfo/Idh/MocA family oxidoreductase [Nanoarchaeota archaeon]